MRRRDRRAARERFETRGRRFDGERQGDAKRAEPPTGAGYGAEAGAGDDGEEGGGHGGGGALRLEEGGGEGEGEERLRGAQGHNEAHVHHPERRVERQEAHGEDGSKEGRGAELGRGPDGLERHEAKAADEEEATNGGDAQLR